eukprot:CAMPEP_0168585814 /NCGR_PEP_ID=MMETSP0420-20121227/3923_1 /TAXON_ID=498008 /ORGANISM="Pessonella sp." /LENGTH=209 /DNA_ID=CAMNT_0008620807 /DNA_START=598 /DNA_END=1224 /DNA_ORIENTATION=+
MGEIIDSYQTVFRLEWPPIKVHGTAADLGSKVDVVVTSRSALDCNLDRDEDNSPDHSCYSNNRYPNSPIQLADWRLSEAFIQATMDRDPRESNELHLLSGDFVGMVLQVVMNASDNVLQPYDVYPADEIGKEKRQAIHLNADQSSKLSLTSVALLTAGATCRHVDTDPRFDWSNIDFAVNDLILEETEGHHHKHEDKHHKDDDDDDDDD